MDRTAKRARAKARKQKARACTGKIAHETRYAARQHAYAHMRDNGGFMDTYRCAHCHKFHIGHARLI